MDKIKVQQVVEKTRIKNSLIAARDELVKHINILDDEIDVLKAEPAQRFYKGQPVLVSNNLLPDPVGECWEKRFYDSFLGGNHCCASASGNGSVVMWPFCKPDLEALSLLNWIEWGGDGEPDIDDHQIVLNNDRDGGFDLGEKGKFDWSHNGSDGDCMRYAIIKAPEWCG